jgi:hypothetical protein
VRQSAIALLDDKDLGALKAMMPHKKNHLTKARMEPIVDSSLDVLISGSMSLLRPAPEKRISPLRSPAPAFAAVHAAASSMSSIS